jgi:hypothetical protein
MAMNATSSPLADTIATARAKVRDLKALAPGPQPAEG